MAIRGNLNDLGLTSIIQMLCAEHRHAAIHLSRSAEEGAVFVDRGNILHAELGELRGEQALYDLLSWEDGEFHVGDAPAILPESIDLSVDHLLLKGARQQDEKPRQLTLSQAEAALDKAAELDLLELLSKVENLASLLQTRKVKRRPIRVFAILQDIANEIIEFAVEVPKRETYPRTLSEVLVEVAKENPHMRHVHVESDRVSLDHVSALYKDLARDPRGKHLMREIKRGFVCLLEIYFSKLVACLPSAATADRWRASYRVFLRELVSSLEVVDI